MVLTGTSFARAGFERFESIFSNVRAREDAENRAARTLGDDLKSRLVAYLAEARLDPPAWSPSRPIRHRHFSHRPDPRYSAVLFYGPDAGLVLERAQALAKACAERERPPGEILRLDDTDLDGDPDRLAVELRTVADVRRPEGRARGGRPARQRRRR